MRCTTSTSPHDWPRWRRSRSAPFHRGAWLAWGLDNGQFSPASFASKAKAAGYSWAALELDDFGNEARWPAFRDACLAEGIEPGCWFTEGVHIVDTPTDSTFAIAELEGPVDYDGIMLAIQHHVLPDCPLAVATNFNVPLTNPQGLPQPDAAAPLIAAGFACLTECYLGDNPTATPDRLGFTGRVLGWPQTQPVFGIYNTPPSTYDQWDSWPGSSDYLAENVL